MNIVNKLTLRHLKENKGRTVVTTLGICVSVAMITAVFVALASFMNLFGEIELMSTGNLHASLTADTAQIQSIMADERIAKVGIESLDDNNSFQLEKCKSVISGTADFCSGDKVFVEQMITGDYDGTLPSKKGEIAVEEDLIRQNSLDWKIGDIVSIPTGCRYIDTPEGVNYIQGTYMGSEKFEGEAQQYKITAILHTNPATAYSPIILCSIDENTKLGKEDFFKANILLKDVNYKSFDVIEEIIKTNNIEEYRINRSYLATCFAIGANDTTISTLFYLTAIILVIIMIASVVLIYNAFAMSISERVRYLGMLSSVGATRVQKKLSVYFESFVLGIMGIPVGMVSGIAGIGITLKVIGGKIISTGMIRGISDSNMKMNVVVPFWAILMIVFFSCFTILISSIVPSVKASKITPIDAIRQTNEIKIKTKKLRSSKLIRKIFGYEGELANKNLKRNSRKSRVITASIAMSVILFISCNYFCSMFTMACDMEADVPYQLLISVNYDDVEQLSKKLDEMSDIKNYYCVNNTAVRLEKSTIKYYAFAQSDNLNNAHKNLFSKKAYAYLNILDDDDFNELCSINNIDSFKYYNSSAVSLLLMNNISHKSRESVFTDNVIGKSVGDLVDTKEDGAVVGDLIDFDKKQFQCNLNPAKSISFYIPLSQYMELTEASVNLSYGFGIECDNPDKTYERIRDYLNESGVSEFYSQNIQESFQVMNTLSFIVQVLCYGFIALISLITIFNIINTISTGVAMRRKEFAMLKSVGTTPKGFNKMIMLESAFYGIKALVVSLPLSAVISYGLFCAVDPTVSYISTIDPVLYIAVVAVVFAVITASMLYSVRKLRNDSIVETLKEEIN